MWGQAVIYNALILLLLFSDFSLKRLEVELASQGQIFTNTISNLSNSLQSVLIFCYMVKFNIYLIHYGCRSFTVQIDSNPGETTCEIKQVSQGRKPHLSIDIPPRNGATNPARANALMPPTSSSLTRAGSGLPPRPASTKVQRSRSSIKKLLSATSFKFANGDAVTDGRNELPVTEGSSRGSRERNSIIRSLSLTKILSPSVRRATSLPVDAEVDLPEKSLHEATSAEGTSTGVRNNFLFQRSKMKQMCNHIIILSPLKLTEKRCRAKNMAVKVGSFKW